MDRSIEEQRLLFQTFADQKYVDKITNQSCTKEDIVPILSKVLDYGYQEYFLELLKQYKHLVEAAFSDYQKMDDLWYSKNFFEKVDKNIHDFIRQYHNDPQTE